MDLGVSACAHTTVRQAYLNEDEREGLEEQVEETVYQGEVLQVSVNIKWRRHSQQLYTSRVGSTDSLNGIPK